MSKRAVLYARVSYDDRDTDGRNLQSQLDMGRERCAEKSYRIVAELSEDDRGASGADFDLPQLNKALEMARAGEFEVLIVRELDRFARGLAKQLIVEGEFKRAGIEVEYVLGEYPDTPEGNLNKNIKAVIAEYERLKITERLIRGRRQKVKAGNVIVSQRPPYGYRVTEKDSKTTLEIHEPEAAIVRLIFTWYTEGDGENAPLSIRAIAKELDGMEVPTRGGGQWSTGTLQAMLSNESYTGIWHYGKNGWKDKRRVRNPDSHLLAVEIPAIITPEVFALAQQRRTENRENAKRNRKHQYLLSRRVTCADCRGKMHGTTKDKGHQYYRCPAPVNRFYRRTCNNTSYFPVDQVDSLTWQWVTEILVNPERLAKGLEDYQVEQDRANEPIRERLKVVESLIADNQQQLDRLLDLYLTGDFSKEMLIDRKERLEATIEALKKEQATLTTKLETQALTTAQILSIKQFAERVGEGLEQADFAARRQIIEDLDVQATLTVEDGEKVAYVSCALPKQEAALTLATNTIHWLFCLPPGRYMHHHRLS